MRLSTFEWALRSAGYSTTSAQAFVLLHTTGVLTKKVDFPEGSLEVQYGNTYLNPRESAVVPAKAYCERWTTGWINRWFYLSTGERITLKSSGTEPNPVPAPEVKVDEGLKLQIVTLAAASRRFSMRDPTEEFVVAGGLVSGPGLVFPVTLSQASRELVTTEDDGTANFRKEGFVWAFPGESFSWEFCPLRRVAHDSSWWILADLTVEEVEQRATVLLGPYRADEHHACMVTVVTVRTNRILALQGVPIPERPVPPPRPPKGQRGRGKKAGGGTDAGSSSRPYAGGDDGEEEEEEV